jgi:AmmeMemoRadiSam system protein B
MASALRPAAVAGTWYPGSAAAIAEAVDLCLAAASVPAVPGRLVGLVSPHAGMRYSGPVAAHSYALLRGRSRLTAVLVGPSHRFTFGGAAVWAKGAFETPMGKAPIDEDLAEAIRAADPRTVKASEIPHGPEHSLEMQLPFLQRLVPDVQIVPILMGEQTRAEVDALARALSTGLAGRDAVLVASSDLSHYHPAPVANRLDAEVVSDVERFDAGGLMARLETDHGHACGGGPIVAVMKASAALGADRATILRYADSGDAGERDKSRVVGYLAAALSAS